MHIKLFNTTDFCKKGLLEQVYYMKKVTTHESTNPVVRVFDMKLRI